MLEQNELSCCWMLLVEICNTVFMQIMFDRLPLYREYFISHWEDM